MGYIQIFGILLVPVTGKRATNMMNLMCLEPQNCSIVAPFNRPNLSTTIKNVYSERH